ncbi:MAG: DUF7059 domain-containing protein [Brachybacterium alimentarium]
MPTDASTAPSAPSAPYSPPTALPEQITALRTDLVAARYTVETTEALMGQVALEALRRENPIPAHRALDPLTEPAAVLFRLFALGTPVPRSLVDAALPTLGAQGATMLGLLGPAPLRPLIGADDHAADDPDPLHAARVELSPYSARDDIGEITWWIASDLSELVTGRALDSEHVLGVGGASLTLARITPRAKVGRVLDLGCGGGIQALHAARHADHVVATDLSDRALAFAAFNAALNETELELRQGSLLDPVETETFDLIVSNPPFVITPRQGRQAAPVTADAEARVEAGEVAREDAGAGTDEIWTYRDGGRAGDSLLADLLTALPAHLAPGGSAVMLGNWEIGAQHAWDVHPRAWLGAATEDGVDAWVIQREHEDPAQYAETWARDGGVTSRDARWPELQNAWLDDFATRDVESIGFGYLLLRRPEAGSPSRPGVLRTEQAAGTGTGSLAAHLAQGLRALDTLSHLDDDALAATRPVRAADVVERRHLTPGEWDPMLIELAQGAGLGTVVRADQLLAATVGALDGTLTLDQVIGAVCALTDADVDESRERMLPLVRDLLVTGMVTL